MNWLKSLLRDRPDAIITHECEEVKDGDHHTALVRGPDTNLPIREGAQMLLRSMRGGPKER